MSRVELTTLQSKINSQTLISRRHYLPGTDIREDDSSHALSVAMLSWYYYQRLDDQSKSELSESKILKYAMAHDLVEIYAGDVIAYADHETLRQKEVNEASALERLAAELSFSDDIVRHLNDYQAKADIESRFVWVCDKIQAHNQGQLDGWRAYIENSISKPMFIDKLEHYKTLVPDIMKSEFDRLSTEWISDYPEI